jgi:pimeloyl-ACP methyl ester carboxylesterase
MVRIVVLFGMVLLAGLLGCPGSGWAQSALPRFETVEEGAPFPVEVSGPRYQRGFLVVAQSDHPDDELELRLPVVIVRARTPVPGLAPVVFLPGGPGVGGLSAAQYPGAYPWSAERDFVIFGRRGTRYAVPSLQCEAIGPALVSRKPGAQSRLEQAIADCQSALEAQGVRREAYNTVASASDLEALRTVLGYEQWSLFALSYGTRLALTYAREYPGRVQSMVLDSPLPHGVHFDDAYPAHLEAALRRVAQMCAESPDCDAAYPDLEERFFAAIEAAPRQCGEDRVCQREIVNSVPLSSASDLQRAPRLMDEATRLETGDEGVGYASDFDWGVRLSVWCSEALPYAQRRNGPLPDSFAGLDSATFTPETCALWDVSVRPEAEIEPTVSSAPALILAGELDALTPPAWGYQATQGLERSRVITLPAGFHTETTNWDGDGCALSLAARFFSSSDEMLEETGPPACVEARSAPEFERR